jgi:biopolymer transport protein ExbB
MSQLGDYYVSGGITMHAITACSILGVAAIVYKLVTFAGIRTDTSAFLREIRSALLQGNLRGALEICDRHRGPVPAVVKTGLIRHGSPRDRIDRAMEATALHEMAFLERYLPLLASVTSLAPMLGFLGTIVGMLGALETISLQGLGNPAAVAGGIRVALVTTAYGLLVAFVVQPFHTYFSTRVSRYAREMESASDIVLDTFDEVERLGARA